MSEDVQQSLVRYWAANEDLRRRNGELATALFSASPEAFESITPGRTINNRSDALQALLIASIAYASGDSTGSELRSAVRDVEEYLPDWIKKLEEDREIARKRAETIRLKTKS